ncbi:MAG: uroporphyrinogen decarboxylase [Hydrogenobaculum sp.]
MKNDILLKSLKKEHIERYPVWLMRQAGRYLPEYRAVRQKYKSFLDFCKNVEDAALVSLQPVDILGVDAVIMFSDILVILEPMGIKVSFEAGEGPKLEHNFDFKSLKSKDIAKDLDYVFELLKVLKERSPVPVIGFCGAPFTLASYVIEKQSSRDFAKTKTFMYENEKDFHLLMEKLSEALVEYIDYQIKSGADVIQIFDSWSMSLSKAAYKEYVYKYNAFIIKSIKQKYPNTPIIYFFRGSSSHIEQASTLGADALSVDWSVCINEVSNTYPSLAFQGNLEPQVLLLSKENIRKHVEEFVMCIPRDTAFIVNLGHGITPDVSKDNVKYFVECVKELSYGKRANSKNS